MALKLERPLVSLDLETTGTDPQKDRIIDIAISCSNGAKAEWRVNPGIPIPPEATAVHGITDSDVLAKPPFSKIASILIRELTNIDLTGYNLIAFDVPMLTKEFDRCAMQWPPSDMRIIDSLAIYRQQEPKDLAHALKFYTGYILGNRAHGAAADAHAALEVLQAQAETYKAHTLDALAALATDPDQIDSTGKLKWIRGKACLTFGKYMGKPLEEVPTDYLSWILSKGMFPKDFMDICREALRGIAPVRR